MVDISTLARPHLHLLKPYSSARDEFNGNAHVWLDANEYPEGSGFNRYPDSSQHALRQQLSSIYGVKHGQLFIGNGSDECIDLLIRAFCEPGVDNVMILTPTYGMYEVCAYVNNIQVVQCSLNDKYNIDVQRTLRQIRAHRPKLIFICSPNNPTGNLLDSTAIADIAKAHDGLLIVDQAYIEFTDSDQLNAPVWLEQFNNVVLLRTLSKAAGLAGIRVGSVIANEEIITLLDKIRAPYNVSSPNASTALESLQGRVDLVTRRNQNIARRKLLADGLASSPLVQKVLPSSANFVLVQFQNSRIAYQTLLAHGVVVRDRSTVIDNGIRITVGTEKEINNLLNILRSIQ